MADNLRSITELEVLTEVPDGTYTVVVDGGTAKLAPYGGGGAEAIEIVYTSADSFETFTCNRTYAEIYAALMTYNGVANIKIALKDEAEGIDGVIFAFDSWMFINGVLFGESVSQFGFETPLGFVIVHDSTDTITVSSASA